MNCRQIEPLLARHLDGRLTERVAAGVLVHVRDCPACGRLRDELRSLGDDLRELSELPPPPDLERHTAARWSAEQGERRAVLTRTGTPRPMAAACLLGAALFAAFLAPRVIPGRHSRPREPGTEIAMRPASLLRSRQTTAAKHPSENGKRSLRRPKAVSLPRGDLEYLNGDRARAFRPWMTPPRDAWNRIEARVRQQVRVRDAFVHTPSLPAPLVSPPLHADDLEYLNGNTLPKAQPWAAISRVEWQRIEARVRRTVRVKDDFITLPFPRLASTAARQIAEAADSYRREAAIVDPHLAREVTCAFKATALSDLCDQIRADAGIQLSAGPSVADEKVTLLCEKLPLRDIMRQLSRPFGYTWLRSKEALGVRRQALGENADDTNAQRPTPNAQYRYELVQDLRSQLLEEELRNRDRDAALLDLEREIERYQPYLSLSPDEALERSKTAAPEEKALLETLAGSGWGPIQMYFRLTSQAQAALRAGQKLTFSDDPARVAGASPKPGDWTKPDALPLPPELGHGVLQSHRDRRVRSDGRMGSATELPDGLPPVLVPEAHAIVTLQIGHGELGQFTLEGGSGVTIGNKITIFGHAFATGISPGVRNPENELTHAALARDPALQGPVTVQPDAAPGLGAASPLLQSKIQNPKSKIEKLTSADVLEALHRTTRMPIVADFYTRLWASEKLSVKNRPLYDALNQLADTLHLRWNKDGHWLQFRSASFYDDRLKEVPNRLLSRWAAARRGNGGLPLDDLIEIAQLSDAQLDSTFMAEGARELWGLEEWDLAHFSVSRPHLRYLAGLTPAQRQAAQTAAGLPFTQLSLAQQQQLIAHLGPRLRTLSELAGATARVEYTLPGGFRWVGTPGEQGRGAEAGPPASDRSENPFGLSLVRAPTREAVLAAARRIEPQADATQVIPTELALTVVYRLVNPETGAGSELGIRALANGSAHMSW